MRSWQSGENPMKVDALHKGRNDWCQLIVKLKRKQGLSASSSLPEIRGASPTASEVEIGKVQAHRGASLTDLRKLMTIYLSGCPEKFKFVLDARLVPKAEEDTTRPLGSLKDTNSVGEITIVRRKNKKAIKEKQRIANMHMSQISSASDHFKTLKANRFTPTDPGQAPKATTRKYDPNQANLLDRMMWEVATMAECNAAALEEESLENQDAPMSVRDIAFDYEDSLEEHGWEVDGDITATAVGPTVPIELQEQKGIASTSLCISCNRGLSARYQLGTPYASYRMQVAFFEPDAESAQTSQDDWICIGKRRSAHHNRPFFDFGIGICKDSPNYIYYDNSQKMHSKCFSTSIPRTSGWHRFEIIGGAKRTVFKVDGVVVYSTSSLVPLEGVHLCSEHRGMQPAMWSGIRISDERYTVYDVLHRLFYQYDRGPWTGGDKALSRLEFTTLIQKGVGIDALRHEVEEVFMLMDVDKSGSLSMNELLQDPLSKDSVEIAESLARAEADARHDRQQQAYRQDGRITAPTPLLDRLLWKVGEMSERRGAPPSVVMEELFTIYDSGPLTSGDKNLSRIEFARLLKNGLGLSAARWEIENVFRVFDSDENQKISLSELVDDPKTREVLSLFRDDDLSPSVICSPCYLYHRPCESRKLPHLLPGRRQRWALREMQTASSSSIT
jgi:Ca2+-binding EF-hand superfamily protein